MFEKLRKSFEQAPRGTVDAGKSPDRARAVQDIIRHLPVIERPDQGQLDHSIVDWSEDVEPRDK